MFVESACGMKIVRFFSAVSVVRIFWDQKKTSNLPGDDRAIRSMRHFKEGISSPVTVKLGARLHLRYPEERFTSSMSGLDLYSAHLITLVFLGKTS